MIVVSLLLILVAVALLVLGLGAGSSALLISSIVASLLAAVALVIGARRAASLRATTVFTEEPRPAEFDRTRESAGRRDAYPPPPAPASSSMPDFAPADVPDFSGAGPSSGAPKSGTFVETSTESPGAAGSGSFAPESSDAPFVASAPFAESAPFAASPPFAESASAETESGAAGRRDDEVAAPSPSPEASAASASARSAAARSAAAEPVAGESGSEEFGSDDDDADPADEPPPQAIRPADTVRIARMTTDVFVVDGRPRYHLAECPHLSGRRAEPVPADEAMELGFTPCSLCRPVDQLVAESARR
jgi:hypothetical protein